MEERSGAIGPTEGLLTHSEEQTEGRREQEIIKPQRNERKPARKQRENKSGGSQHSHG